MSRSKRHVATEGMATEVVHHDWPSADEYHGGLASRHMAAWPVDARKPAKEWSCQTQA